MDIIPPPQQEFLAPEFNKLTMLIFGIPGVGKTSFLAGAPNTLFLATEPGHDTLRGTVVELYKPVHKDNNPENPIVINSGWERFTATIKGLADQKQAGTLQYTSVVIDIVDNLNEWCRDWVCAQKGMAYPSNKDFGKTWAECNKTWKDWLRVLMSICHVRFVSHTRTEELEITNEQGITEEIQQFRPTFSGNRAAQYLDGVVSAMGFVAVAKTGQRVITFAQSPRVAAKDRTGILAGMGIITLPSDPYAAFNFVAEAYAAKANELGIKLH